MNAADLAPVAHEARTQSPFDLFLIFAGASIVATTWQVGASLGTISTSAAIGIIAIGSLIGASFTSLLAPVGVTLGVPSIVASRAALGMRGASLVAFVLWLTNFAWIALNNVIAASVSSRAFGDAAVDPRWWSFAFGVIATFIVTRGPRAVGLADRIAVPSMGIAGLLITVAVLRMPAPPPVAVEASAGAWWRALDVVMGYQASWLLMFADYPRYSRSRGASARAVFLGLALPALWLMPLGFVVSRAAGTDDPGAMIAATGVGRAGAVLVVLATVTTNFVNIYMSALAWRSLAPSTRQAPAIWTIGLVGTAAGLLSPQLLDAFASFMILLGGILVPIGGILIGHFVVLPRIGGDPSVWAVDVASLYDERGPLAGVSGPAAAAWTTGALAYYAAQGHGATLVALAVTLLVYLVTMRRISRRRRSGA
jgi:purine-cytosine permease-like protein